MEKQNRLAKQSRQTMDRSLAFCGQAPGYFLTACQQWSFRVPSVINLSSLQILELFSNRLDGRFPSFPQTITRLDIKDNRFTGIPDMTGNLPALKILYIYANTLSFNELSKVYLLGITTINSHSQWHFPVETRSESGKVILTMKVAGKVKTYYRWYRNGEIRM